MPKERADKLVAERGLAESRTQAQAMILAGQIVADGQRVDKPGQMLDSNAELRIKGEKPRYVSRGGLKLEAALREFSIDCTGRTCVDVGASTGGFTDCLLQHRAARVWAIDVGHNQLDWRLRQDSRVVVMEGVNARNLEPDQFPVRFDVATVDISFISLTKILPALSRVLTDAADCIVLVKPQFEVGKGEVGRGGLVRDPLKHRRVLFEIKEAAARTGLVSIGVIASPIPGAEGNREFLLYFKPAQGLAETPRYIDEKIIALTS
jgi:23S rRNA (cytidine1920-2'-O)/16S rRNA (cytidine1409-2'-O)-methyltransferase